VRFDPPLVEATLLRRYKRFFADVRFDDGSEDTAHTNNTGRMTGCATPGARVLLSRAPEGNKLAWRWHAVKTGRVWTCVDTQLPNRVVLDALRRRAIPELTGYAGVRGEVRLAEVTGARATRPSARAVGSRSTRSAPRTAATRFDVGLWRDADTRAAPPDALVEVKNVTLRDGRLALFPDAPSERGRKHLAELAQLARDGTRAVLIPFVGRADVRAFDAAVEVDPAWAAALDDAAAAGVLVLPLQARLGPREVRVTGPLAWERRPR